MGGPHNFFSFICVIYTLPFCAPGTQVSLQDSCPLKKMPKEAMEVSNKLQLDFKWSVIQHPHKTNPTLEAAPQLYSSYSRESSPDHIRPSEPYYFFSILYLLLSKLCERCLGISAPYPSSMRFLFPHYLF